MPMKAVLAFSGKRFGLREVQPFASRQIGMNRPYFNPIQPTAAVDRKNRPKSKQRNAHGGAFVDPFLVAPRFENARRVDDAFEHLAVGAAANGVGGNEAGGLQFSGGDLRAGFLEPVGDEVGAAGNAAVVGLAQRFDVVVAEFAAHDLVAEERRVADDDVGGRPFGFAAVRVEQRVAVFDAVERFQDRVDGVRVAVAPAPLDVADPDGDAGEFGGEFVDFQPEDVVRAGMHDQFGAEAEFLGVDVGALLDVAQGGEREVEEVAASRRPGRARGSARGGAGSPGGGRAPSSASPAFRP